jgi:lysozyme family protein
MTDLFEKCISVVLKNEGNFQNDPNDLGNWVGDELRGTKYGIAAKYNPELDIKNLTLDQAKEIYYEKYWLPMFLEGIENEESVLQIFDFGVNAGTRKAIRFAQQVSGAFVDGIMGPASIQAINNCELFIQKYKRARIDYYSSIALGKRRKFLTGWINRINNCHL